MPQRGTEPDSEEFAVLSYKVLMTCPEDKWVLAEKDRLSLLLQNLGQKDFPVQLSRALHPMHHLSLGVSPASVVSWRAKVRPHSFLEVVVAPTQDVPKVQLHMIPKGPGRSLPLQERTWDPAFQWLSQSFTLSLIHVLTTCPAKSAR